MLIFVHSYSVVFACRLDIVVTMWPAAFCWQVEGESSPEQPRKAVFITWMIIRMRNMYFKLYQTMGLKNWMSRATPAFDAIPHFTINSGCRLVNRLVNLILGRQEC